MRTKIYFRTGILDSTGELVVEYSYDVWGKLLNITGSLATSIGIENPFRYRSYYYDNESGLYYLQRRYYDAGIGRFINADYTGMILLSENILGGNLFSYCNNNPIIYDDDNGYLPKKVNKLLKKIKPSVIYASFSTLLYISYKEALFKIGLYVASVVLPPIATLYWWQPWLVAGIVTAAVAISVGLFVEYFKKKSPNLPSIKKLFIDMNHIMSGHFPGGPRNTKGEKDVFYGMTAETARRAIIEAYEMAKKLQTQVDGKGNVIVLLQGYSQTYKMTIQIYVNITKKIITTAFPK